MHTPKHIYTHTVYTYMCAHTYIHYIYYMHINLLVLQINPSYIIE